MPNRGTAVARGKLAVKLSKDLMLLSELRYEKCCENCRNCQKLLEIIFQGI